MTLRRLVTPPPPLPQHSHMIFTLQLYIPGTYKGAVITVKKESSSLQCLVFPPSLFLHPYSIFQGPTRAQWSQWRRNRPLPCPRLRPRWCSRPWPPHPLSWLPWWVVMTTVINIALKLHSNVALCDKFITDLGRCYRNNLSTFTASYSIHLWNEFHPLCINGLY